MKGLIKEKERCLKETFKFSERDGKKEAGRRGTRMVPAQHALTITLLNGQLY